jgi:hypothetical protein
MGYFRAPYWDNLIIRSSFSHLFIKRFSIPDMDAVYRACGVFNIRSPFSAVFKTVISRFWTIYSINLVSGF